MGDTNPTVFVVPNRGNGRGKYHTDRDCPRLPAQVFTRPLEEVTKLDWDECAFCRGDVDTSGGDSQRRSLRHILQDDN